MTDQSQSPVLDINDVSAGYDGKNIISNVNLKVERGEFFGLIGLNGAGKTTLIKSILGLKEPSAGTIKLFECPNKALEGKKHMAYLPERFEPPWFLSGMEFLKFSASLYSKTVEQDVIFNLADSLALDRAALKRRVQSYSKGMRQKLGLMGVIVTGCDLLILDEPMSGLDPLARTLVKDMLLEAKAAGKTIFLSSHILADLDEICDRVAILNDGSIQYIGTPKVLKKKTGIENLERSFLHFIEKDKAA